MNLKQADSQTIWHPYTQMQLHPETTPIVRGEGAWLIDEDGNRILDAVSSWWVNTHGHCHPHVAAEVSKQLHTLEHAIFAGFTHPKAVELATRLLPHLKGQERVFFSDNGSTAVEVALKMAFQYFHNKGESRPRVVALEGAYHGDTFGAMAVSGRSAFSDPFAPWLFDVDHIPFPEAGAEEACLAALDAALATGEVAAVIVEPLVQGASGMRIYNTATLQAIMSRAQAAGALAIADEVFAGFGRTASWFATDKIEAEPDIYCLSKGLTGGFMALGVTTCKAFIYDAFLSDDRLKTFFHGHSFTANPVACSAACASLDVFERPETWENIARIESLHQEAAKRLDEHPCITNVRVCGTILALDLVAGDETSYFNAIRDTAYDFFIERNLLLRPLGNTIYTVPPYCTTNQELATVYNAMEAFANTLT